MEQNKRRGIGEYLAGFDKSPYSYPANDRRTVVGESKLKGSWVAPKPD